MISEFLFITASRKDVRDVVFETSLDIVLILKDSHEKPDYCVLDSGEAAKTLNMLISAGDDFDLIFIAKEDQFDCSVLRNAMEYIYNTKLHTGLTVLIPYKTAPLHTYRLDGKAGSLLVSGSIKADYAGLVRDAGDFQFLTYCICQEVLNSKWSTNINVHQVGRETATVPRPPASSARRWLARSLLVIPHKGPVRLLERCMRHLNKTEFLPGKINLCFDDHQYKKWDIDKYQRLKGYLDVYCNSPANVGPYLARHYSVTNAPGDYIFFQDSDDISAGNRFWLQIKELTAKKLDMIGSHELRIDELKQAVIAVRFPINVNAALEAGSFLPLFHPTSVITKKAYERTMGFSTDLKFGYDAQFTMRCFFFLRMGNVDEFLYVRFRRRNSLTTKPKTKMGSKLRNFLLWRWSTDFRLVKAGKLDLWASSLGVYRHKFVYRMKRLVRSKR